MGLITAVVLTPVVDFGGQHKNVFQFLSLLTMDGAGNYNHSSWKSSGHLSYTDTTMTAKRMVPLCEGSWVQMSFEPNQILWPVEM